MKSLHIYPKRSDYTLGGLAARGHLSVDENEEYQTLKADYKDLLDKNAIASLKEQIRLYKERLGILGDSNNQQTT